MSASFMHCCCSGSSAEPSCSVSAGDLTYADAFDPDAAPRGSLSSGSAASGAKWDAWGRLTSSLFAQARLSGASARFALPVQSKPRVRSFRLPPCGL